MRHLISDILRAIERRDLSLRSLKGYSVDCDPYGRPLFSVGESVVVFRVRREDRCFALRCYRDRHPYLREIYGESYYPEEMVIYSDSGEPSYVDVVVCGWIFGETLEEVILRGVRECDTQLLGTLSRSFELLAEQMLVRDDWAHGDICCENIIVDGAGVMHLIDHDANYVESLRGMQRYEGGRLVYQSRLTNYKGEFSPEMDSYPIAIIATSLHALALDPMLGRSYSVEDMLLVDGQSLQGGNDKVLKRCSATLAERGDFVGYRLSRELSYGDISTERLLSLLRFSLYGNRGSTQGCRPSLFERRGIWGYEDINEGGEMIPTLFDEGFEFRDGRCSVRIGDYWFCISLEGKILR